MAAPRWRHRGRRRRGDAALSNTLTASRGRAMDSSPDVLVIGGGPAGASAARLLAAWGHRVRLVTRAAGDARLAESLPPSCGKLFDAIGVSAAIERAGFIRSTGNTVSWGNDAPRVELFAEGGRGWQIEASALSAVLARRGRAGGRPVGAACIHRRPAAGSGQPPVDQRRAPLRARLQWTNGCARARVRASSVPTRARARLRSWRAGATNEPGNFPIRATRSSNRTRAAGRGRCRRHRLIGTLR